MTLDLYSHHESAQTMKKKKLANWTSLKVKVSAAQDTGKKKVKPQTVITYLQHVYLA